MKRSFEALENLEYQRKGIDCFETLVRYIMSARTEISIKDVYEVGKNISLERSENIITIAEQLIKEDIERGIEKGRAEGMEKEMEKGKAELLIKQLTKKLGILPSTLQDSIANASPLVLDSLAENIFDIDSIEKVMDFIKSN